MDSGQLLERFRLLSRDIQNGLQNSQRHMEVLRKTQGNEKIGALSSEIEKISAAWQDFSGWVLVSTLDDLSEARKNCAPGRVNIGSKITRAQKRRKNDLSLMGIKVASDDIQEVVVETFIPYFEQLLDLIFGNAIKYSPKAGHIELSCNRNSSGVIVSIKSVGPLCKKYELPQLGQKGFRSENAMRVEVSGQGYGLYNCKKLSKLLGVTMEFRPEQKVLYESNNISYANFQVLLRIPFEPPKED